VLVDGHQLDTSHGQSFSDSFTHSCRPKSLHVIGDSDWWVRHVRSVVLRFTSFAFAFGLLEMAAAIFSILGLSSSDSL